MNEKLKSIVFELDVKDLLELFNICNMRYFELYIENNFEYATRYKDICVSIRQELINREIWKQS